ncbi:MULTISPECIES: DUF2057 family protein [unclassified Vibrio]|uniref:DUF2057 family protein n=1 Tax=unclassified Vibrio TaxID=2614977 RepID=UPI002F40C627
MMKWMLTFCALFSFTASAAVLTPAKGLSVLYINGEQSESKIGKLDIPQGSVQLVVQMDKELGRGNSAKVFTSYPYVINFNVTGNDIVIDHPTARSTQEAVNAFKSEQPEWKLSQDGQSLNYTQDLLPSNGSLFPYVAMDKLVAEYNQSKGIFFEGGKLIDKPVEAQVIAVATTSTAVTSTASQVEKTSPAKPVASSNVEQLKAWYLKSSQQERKEFRRWMIDQE